MVVVEKVGIYLFFNVMLVYEFVWVIGIGLIVMFD